MFEIYKTGEGKELTWDWRLLLGPGKRTVAISAGSFKKRSQALADIEKMRELAPAASVFEAL
jgi:uncharacterized protein YegP (UPF0339 family)